MVAAIYRKFPAAKGRIKVVNPPSLLARIKPSIVPRIAVVAVMKLNVNAFFFDNPEYNSTPKSEISWGISWNITEIVAAIPTAVFTTNAPAITKPSMKLWIASPIRFIGAKL